MKTCLVIQWLGRYASTAGSWVQILMGEPRSCMLGNIAKGKKSRAVGGQKKCGGKGDQGRSTWSSTKGFHGKDFKCEGKE